jgi:exonuclease SbcC
VPVKIRVKNFQSLEDAQLEVSGLTVVTGSNNSGKTALLRAVRGVFANTGGMSMLRHGTDVFNVNVDFGDADVTWSKGTKIRPTYTIGGKTIAPGRDVPSEVRSLGVQPIKAGTSDVWPQIAPQFTGQVFLLDQSGANLAEALSDVDRVGRLSDALRLAETDRRQAASDIKLRRKDLEEARLHEAKFVGLPSAEAAATAVQEALQAVRALSADVETVRVLQASLEASRARLARLTEAVGSLTVPTVDAIRDLVRQVSEFKALRQRREAALPLARAELPEVPSTVAAEKALALREDLTRWRGQIVRLRRASTPLPTIVVPTSEDADRCRSLLKDCEWVRAQRARLNSLRVAVKDLPQIELPEPPSKLDRMLELRSFLEDTRRKIRGILATTQAVETQLDSAQREVQDAEAEVSRLMSAAGVCPTCKGTGSAPCHES